MPQQVAATLHEKILNGEFRPSQQLVEADLGERPTISRNPLREALRQLVGEGLLVYKFIGEHIFLNVLWIAAR